MRALAHGQAVASIGPTTSDVRGVGPCIACVTATEEECDR
jgi:hypothetical protein